MRPSNIWSFISEESTVGRNGDRALVKSPKNRKSSTGKQEKGENTLTLIWVLQIDKWSGPGSGQPSHEQGQELCGAGSEVLREGRKVS